MTKHFVPGWCRMKREEFEENNNILTSDSDLETLVIDRGPFFDKSASKNVTALVGKTTHLNCRIRNLGNRTVSLPKHIIL